jgi:hypothetical protein
MSLPQPVREPPPGEATVDRIISADARAVLDRLAGANLVERGAVTVISVESIRARAGQRWPRKADDVRAYVERKCDEHLSFQDIRHRIGETDFLIAMTTEEGIAAQAISLKILEEVLVFFLGAAEAADILVSAVTAIEGDRITTAAVDLARLAAVRRRAPGGACTTDVDPREAARRNPISFVTAAGERVRIDFAVEPVVNLGHNVASALRVQPTARFISTGALIPVRAFPKLADEDIAFIDRSTLEFAALYMPKNLRRDPPLILPASFRTMGGRKGRNALLGVNGASPEQIRQGVMIEFIDVDIGTPTARLAEVTSLVGQLCRSVIARIWPMRDALAPLRGARLQGLTFDVRELPMDDIMLGALLRQIALLSRGKAPALIAQGLPHSGWFRRMHECGFTHASAEVRPPAAREDEAPPVGLHAIGSR